MVTAIKDISKSIQKYTTKKPSAGIIGAATTTLTIFNHAALPKNVKDGYLDKGNPQIPMNGDNMKTFNTGIPDPSDPIVTTMFNQEYHI